MVLIFIDKASPKGLKLNAIINSNKIHHLEITRHFTATEGDFILTEYFNKEHETRGKEKLFLSFKRLKKYIDTTYGLNNLSKFYLKAVNLQKEMLELPEVKKWKKR